MSELESHLFAVKTTGGQEKVVMRLLEAKAEARANAEAEMVSRIEDAKAAMSSRIESEMSSRISRMVDPIYDMIFKVKKEAIAGKEAEASSRIEDVTAETSAKIGTAIIESTNTSIEPDIKVDDKVSAISKIGTAINELIEAKAEIKAETKAEMLAKIESETSAKIESETSAKIGTMINELIEAKAESTADAEAEMLAKIEDIKAETKAKTSQMNVKSVLLVNDLKGYVVIEAVDPNDTFMALQGVRHIREQLRGELDFKDIEGYLIKRSTVSQLGVDNIVEITGGPFKGMKATITRVDVESEEAIVVLLDAAYQLPVTIDANYLKITSEA